MSKGHERVCEWARARALLGIAALVAATAMGCKASIPEARFHVLASSGARILTTTGDTYARIARIQQAFVIASMGDEKLTVDSFRPVVEGRSFDLEPELALRQAALGVLVKYLRVLDALASGTADADVDKASLDLASALRGLAAVAGHEGDRASQVAGIFATAVDAIGREIASGERRSALGRVMDASQKDVERLAHLVSQSHAKLDRAIGVMVAQIVARANIILPPAGTVLRDDFYTRLANRLRDASEARAALAAMAEATEEIPAAHAQIRLSLEQKVAPLDALKSLAEKAERAGGFYAETKD
jgi:hypothetical protein